jgi:hypothetical protein
MGEVYREAEMEGAVSLSKSDSDLRCEDAIGYAISGCLSAADYIEEFEEAGGIEEAAAVVGCLAGIY